MTTRSFRCGLLVGLLAQLSIGLGFATSAATSGGCAHVHGSPTPAVAVPPTKPDHEQATETGVTMASTPQGLMREGAERRLQLRLYDKGFLPAGHDNGQLDAGTREALRSYQKSEGLPTTGLPSYETVRHLGLDLDTIFRTVTPSASQAGELAPHGATTTSVSSRARPW